MKVLDIEGISIDLGPKEFENDILKHLYGLKSLEYLNIPNQPKIKFLRFFVIYHLPKLKYINWDPVTEEEIERSKELYQKGIWKQSDNMKTNNIGDFNTAVHQNELSVVSPVKKEEQFTHVNPMEQTYDIDAMLESFISGVNVESNNNNPQEQIDNWDILDEFLETATAKDNKDIVINDNQWDLLEEYVEDNLLDQIKPILPKEDDYLETLIQFSNDNKEETDDDVVNVDLLKNVGKRPVRSYSDAIAPKDSYMELVNSLISEPDKKPVKPKKEYVSDDPLVQSIDSFLNEFTQTKSSDTDQRNKDHIIQQKKESRLNVIDSALNILENDEIKEFDENPLIEDKTTTNNESNDDLSMIEDPDLIKQLNEITFKEESVNKTSRIKYVRKNKRNDSNIKNDLISRYNIPIERIEPFFSVGKGSFGETFKVKYKTQDNDVKICAMKKLYSRSLVDNENLIREVKSLQQLQNKHIVSFEGCGSDKGQFILREFIEGESLKDFFDNNTRLIEAPFIINISRQICDTLCYLHSQNIIHGGIKMENIILKDKSDVILVDYGFLEYKKETPLENFTSIEYMAPEYINGYNAGDFNEKIDVYSFGILLYHLFVKKLPFDNIQNVKRDLESLKGLKPRINDDDPILPVFRRLILTCWNEDPSSRPTFDKIVKILQVDIQKLLSYK